LMEKCVIVSLIALLDFSLEHAIKMQHKEK